MGAPRTLERSSVPAPPGRVPPERLVDEARRAEGLELRSWCAQIAYSPEARAELDLIAAFDDESASAASRWAVERRIAMAVEGALATRDDSDA